MNEPNRYRDAVKASHRAALLTLLGFAIVLAALAYSAYQLNALDRDLRDKESQIQEKARQIDQLEAKVGELTQERSRLENEIVEKRAELGNVAAQLEQGRVDVAKQILAPTATELSTPEPRIYIQIRSEAQLGASRRIAETLRGKGFIVPQAEILVDEGPDANQLRYFRQSEEGEARHIVGLLQAGFPTEHWATQYIRGYEDAVTIRPHHFELWLRPGAFLE